MNLPQALQIVIDHIRIGKGMELVNRVPEALEAVVTQFAEAQAELKRYQDIECELCGEFGIREHIEDLQWQMEQAQQRNEKLFSDIIAIEKNTDYLADKCAELTKELEVTQKALNLACEMIARDFGIKTKSFPGYFLAQAKGGNDETEQASGDY